MHHVSIFYIYKHIILTLTNRRPTLPQRIAIHLLYTVYRDITIIILYYTHIIRPSRNLATRICFLPRFAPRPQNARSRSNSHSTPPQTRNNGVYYIIIYEIITIINTKPLNTSVGKFEHLTRHWRRPTRLCVRLFCIWYTYDIAHNCYYYYYYSRPHCQMQYKLGKNPCSNIIVKEIWPCA